MKPKHWYNIFHVIVNANLTVQLGFQIKIGITKYVSVNVDVKSVAGAKKMRVEIKALVFVRMVNI